jgi:hypothetical protein
MLSEVSLAWQVSPSAEIAEILDSSEVTSLIAELDALRWTGRKGYGARALVGACLVKSLYAIATWTRVASLIAEHQSLQSALGGTPSHWPATASQRNSESSPPSAQSFLILGDGSAGLSSIAAALLMFGSEYGRRFANRIAKLS